MCVYICMYVSVLCVCMQHTCMCAYMQTCMDACACLCMYMGMCMYLHVCVYVCILCVLCAVCAYLSACMLMFPYKSFFWMHLYPLSSVGSLEFPESRHFVFSSIFISHLFLLSYCTIWNNYE